jgi:hypothetical protein
LEEKGNCGFSDGEMALKLLQVRKWFFMVVKDKEIQSWRNKKKK